MLVPPHTWCTIQSFLFSFLGPSGIIWRTWSISLRKGRWTASSKLSFWNPAGWSRATASKLFCAYLSLGCWKVQEGTGWEVTLCQGSFRKYQSQSEGCEKNWRLKLPFASSPLSQDPWREGVVGLAGWGQAAERKGHPKFLVAWKRRIPALFLSSPSSRSFGLQLRRPGFQPSLTLLPSARKTLQLQTQVKQIFVAASKFQRLFIARLSTPGAKSCC